jgi:polysaccharide deacetylase 2 family uncharacterized protein YibQ
MALFALIALAAILGGYLGGWMLLASKNETQVAVQQPVPPPPAAATEVPLAPAAGPPDRLVLPASPIFPEGLGNAPSQEVRPYEEPLPTETNAPPAPPTKPAVVTPPAPGSPLPAWRQFALAAPPDNGKPKIAVVIDDLGLDRHRTAAIIDLNGPLTLSFLAYAGDLPQQTRNGRSHGHELLVHVPMQPLGAGIDAGPNVLTVGLPAEEVLKRLRHDLSQFDGYIGINNHMGSRFTADEAGMALVLNELKSRGLMFLDSVTTGRTVGPRIAGQIGMAYAERNVFLDNENRVEAVQAQLAELEATARKHGHAIAIGHPRDATIKALTGWLATLDARGFQLVPLSALTRPETAGG